MIPQDCHSLSAAKNPTRSMPAASSNSFSPYNRHHQLPRLRLRRHARPQEKHLKKFSKCSSQRINRARRTSAFADHALALQFHFKIGLMKSKSTDPSPATRPGTRTPRSTTVLSLIVHAIPRCASMTSAPLASTATTRPISVVVQRQARGGGRFRSRSPPIAARTNSVTARAENLQAAN